MLTMSAYACMPDIKTCEILNVCILIGLRTNYHLSYNTTKYFDICCDYSYNVLLYIMLQVLNVHICYNINGNNLMNIEIKYQILLTHLCYS